MQKPPYTSQKKASMNNRLFNSIKQREINGFKKEKIEKIIEQKKISRIKSYATLIHEQILLIEPRIESLFLGRMNIHIVNFLTYLRGLANTYQQMKIHAYKSYYCQDLFESISKYDLEILVQSTNFTEMNNSLTQHFPTDPIKQKILLLLQLQKQFKNEYKRELKLSHHFMKIRFHLFEIISSHASHLKNETYIHHPFRFLFDVSINLQKQLGYPKASELMSNLRRITLEMESMAKILDKIIGKTSEQNGVTNLSQEEKNLYAQLAKQGKEWFDYLEALPENIKKQFYLLNTADTNIIINTIVSLANADVTSDPDMQELHFAEEELDKFKIENLGAEQAKNVINNFDTSP